ncbi:MAG: hypothetical protein WD894_09105 [Pirellulales bacterium]
MRLDLSLFSDRYLESFTLCSLAKPADAKHLSFVSEDQTAFLSRQDGPSEPIWFRLFSNLQKDPDGVHFHINAAKASFFPDGPPPDSELNPAEFEEYLERFRGTNVNATVRTRFEVPRPNLRKESVINVLMTVTVGPPNVEAGLTGSRYELREGPVKEVRWALSEVDGHESIEVSIHSRQRVAVDEGVMTTLFGPIQTAFRSLILEEGVD